MSDRVVSVASNSCVQVTLFKNYSSNIVKFAEKIEVEVYANQQKSVSAVTKLIKYVFSFEFSS